jgi:hypothetical protein
MKYCTVVILHNIELNTPPIPFADGFVFTDLPEWIRSDKWIDRLSNRDAQDVREARHAFVAEYSCDALGEVDPRWVGREAKSKQAVKSDIASLGNLALWLANPSPARVGMVFHCPSDSSGGFVIQQSLQGAGLHCHPDDVGLRLSVEDVKRAANLHQRIVDMHLKQMFWPPTLIAWSFLQSYSELIRYLLCWVALESLFGAADSRELSFRLAQRIGFFLGSDRAQAKLLFDQAKDGYALRSKIAHGRWKYDPETTKKMRISEELIRTALVRILEDARLLDIFTGKDRESFLDNIAFG